MARAVWTPAAKSDLESIVHFIAQRDGRRSTARKIYREIRQQCDEYATAFAAGDRSESRRHIVDSIIQHIFAQLWSFVLKFFRAGGTDSPVARPILNATKT